MGKDLCDIIYDLISNDEEFVEEYLNEIGICADDFRARLERKIHELDVRKKTSMGVRSAGLASRVSGEESFGSGYESSEGNADMVFPETRLTSENETR